MSVWMKICQPCLESGRLLGVFARSLTGAGSGNRSGVAVFAVAFARAHFDRWNGVHCALCTMVLVCLFGNVPCSVIKEVFALFIYA